MHVSAKDYSVVNFPIRAPSFFAAHPFFATSRCGIDIPFRALCQDSRTMNDSASPLPSVTLASHQTHRCLTGHPWIFRSELGDLAELHNGEAVTVLDQRKRPLGIGLYSAKSQIAIRLLTRQPLAIDRTFFRQRLLTAIALREARLPGRAARRLVSSEADLIPGLIVDQYGERLVIQTTTYGMDQRQEIVIEILQELLHPTQIIERNDLAVRELEGLAQRCAVVYGSADTRTTVRVGKLEVDIDLLDPHKTGSYLDQQLAHEQLMAWITPGDRVLDVCCHLGGFAIHALLAGAREAVSIDQAEASVRGAIACAARAGVADRFSAVHDDAFAWMKAADARRENFDVVILDPPSFTRNRAGVAAALRGYHELHLRALRRLQPGGRLLTFSCSHHVSREDFLGTVLAAAGEARRTLRLDAHWTASPDHPVLPGVPETEYLKGFVLTVIDG